MSIFLASSIGVLVVTKERHFPGWWAVLPVLGAVLIIAAGAQAWLNRVVLSNRVLVWFGLISFPLYLWHWPLLSFARIIESETPSREIRIAAVLIAIGLAWLTYRLIEKPIRFGRRAKRKTIALLVLMLVVAYVGINCQVRGGLSFREVVTANYYTGYDGGVQGVKFKNCDFLNENERALFGNCEQDPRQAPKYALVGDSHATALWTGLVRTSMENGRWLLIGGVAPGNSLVPVLSKNKIYESRQKSATVAIEALAKSRSIETVVFMVSTRALFLLNGGDSIEDLPASNNYEAALDGLSNAVDEIIKHGKNIVLVVDNPTLPDPKDCFTRSTSSEFLNRILLSKTNVRCRLDINRHIELSKIYRNLLTAVASANPEKVKIFDTTKYM